MSASYKHVLKYYYSLILKKLLKHNYVYINKYLLYYIKGKY